MNSWSSRRRVHMHGSIYVSALQRFVAAEAMGMAPPTVERYQRVLDHLLRYLDHIDVASSLGDGPAALLEHERQFRHDGAFFRIFGLDELVCCVPGFLEAPWLMAKSSDARTQISLVARLLKRLRRDRLIDLGIVACAYWDAETAVLQARRSMRPAQPARPPLRLVRGGRE